MNLLSLASKLQMKYAQDFGDDEMEEDPEPLDAGPESAPPFQLGPPQAHSPHSLQNTKKVQTFLEELLKMDLINQSLFDMWSFMLEKHPDRDAAKVLNEVVRALSYAVEFHKKYLSLAHQLTKEL